jgi:hypothetical protein
MNANGGTPVMIDPANIATSWLDRTYGGLVVLDGTEPVDVSERAVLLGCRYADRRDAGVPMLAATLCVPRDGSEPFPVANADPFDEELNLSRPPGSDPRLWRWRLNARNCLVATDAAVDHRPVSALPWQPADERPGWWDRLLTAYFPGAEVATCSRWEEAATAVADGGPGTRAAVWLRRRSDGRDVTGHLLYAVHHEGAAVFLDGQRGEPARVDDAEVGELVVARVHRPVAAGSVPRWEAAAPDFAAALDKATSWLEHTYGGDAALVEPAPADELERGWLFACSTKAFLAGGDWREQMLDAALVVPKAARLAPFGLPNHDPWNWLRDWDAGRPELPAPPAPGAAAWFGPTTAQLPPILSEHAHRDWAGVLGELIGSPVDTRALIWLRRKDSRGRESVGNLLWGIKETGGVKFVDPLADHGQPTMTAEPFELRVFRVN